jgi:mannose-6-phosphate isomerase-like protein (cupin superfamily)
MKNQNYTEERPWGTFEILEDRKLYKLKEIVVNPGQRFIIKGWKFGQLLQEMAL